MNDCSRAIDWLLEADGSVLRGEGDSPEAAHVRTCPRCAELAGSVLAGTEKLGDALGAAPGVDVEAILARARLGAVDGDRPDAVDPPSRNGGAHRLRPRPWWTLLAAAAIGGVLLLGERERALPGAPFAPRTPAERPLVETTGDRDVAVIETDNPDITVLWFFPQ